MNRRTFLTHHLAAVAVLGTGPLAFAQAATAPADAKRPASSELKRPTPLTPEVVHEFVVAGHTNLPRVKEMLASEPNLINAMWDWGSGDWETALGGCSHIGNRELALHLLEAGARFDLFSAGMLGESDIVTTSLRVHPALANARGPHGYTLLYHVGYTGNVPLAETVSAHLAADQRGRHFNQTLHSTVGRGHTELVAFLLDHGVDDPNGKNFAGKTPLDVAITKKFEPIVKLLREHGGLTSG